MWAKQKDTNKHSKLNGENPEAQSYTMNYSLWINLEVGVVALHRVEHTDWLFNTKCPIIWKHIQELMKREAMNLKEMKRSK